MVSKALDLFSEQNLPAVNSISGSESDPDYLGCFAYGHCDCNFGDPVIACQNELGTKTYMSTKHNRQGVLDFEF